MNCFEESSSQLLSNVTPNVCQEQLSGRDVPKVAGRYGFHVQEARKKTVELILAGLKLL